MIIFYSIIIVHKGFLENSTVLIEGVLFRARYLGSTQLTTEGLPTKETRMTQAEEAVSRIKVNHLFVNLSMWLFLSKTSSFSSLTNYKLVLFVFFIFCFVFAIQHC